LHLAFLRRSVADFLDIFDRMAERDGFEFRKRRLLKTLSIARMRSGRSGWPAPLR
jgi:predicted AAA+ superfamily ATPase